MDLTARKNEFISNNMRTITQIITLCDRHLKFLEKYDYVRNFGRKEWDLFNQEYKEIVGRRSDIAISLYVDIFSTGIVIVIHDDMGWDYCDPYEVVEEIFTYLLAHYKAMPGITVEYPCYNKQQAFRIKPASIEGPPAPFLSMKRAFGFS